MEKCDEKSDYKSRIRRLRQVGQVQSEVAAELPEGADVLSRASRQISRVTISKMTATNGTRRCGAIETRDYVGGDVATLTAVRSSVGTYWHLPSVYRLGRIGK